MSNFLKRFLTAVVLIPLVLASIFLLPRNYFLGVLTIVLLIAGWEWAGLCGIKHYFSKSIYSLLTGAIFCLSFSVSLYYVLWLDLAFLFLAFVSLWKDFPWCKKFFFTGFSGLVMLPACFRGIESLNFMSPHPWKLIICLMIVWLSDTLAFFIGKAVGKHPLAKTISPKKTLEGAVGALIIVSILTGFVFHSIQGVMIGLITGVASIVGDLYESYLKRQQNLKDSGNLLPGHGGILDRIDSLIAAVPVFLFIILLSNLQ